MIRMRWLILAFGTLLALAGRAGAQGPAVTAVNKAIQAQGGMAALERARAMSRKSSGTMVINAKELPFSSELVADLPDRYRLAVELGPEKMQILTIVNRDKGWHLNAGSTIEMTRESLAEAREEGYVLLLSTLAPLINEKQLTLQMMRGEKFQGKEVTVVKAAMMGHDDVLLYFDKESNLLVKMSRKTVFSGLTADREYIFDYYKEFKGAKLPTKMQELLNGRKYMEHTISGYHFYSEFKAKEFDKP
jgi:hypothetical protein